MICYYSFFYSFGEATWLDAFLLGTSLSSTDPVAVISVLRSLNAPDKLCSIFDAESLINDGVSVSFFTFFLLLLEPDGLTVGGVIWVFVKLMFLGTPWGLLCAVVVHVWLLFFKGHDLMQVVVVVV